MKQNMHCLTLAALGAAVVCVSTCVLRFPIPLGYAHLGNGMILLFSVYGGPRVGAIAGGIGSMLADLLGFPQWALPTLVIKTLMGFAVSVISGTPTRARVRRGRTFFAVLTGIVIMVAGYFLFGAILYGSFITGAAQIPGLAAEGFVGMVLFYVLGGALEATHLTKIFLVDEKKQ